MRENFQVNYKENVYDFELDRDGYIWLLDRNNINSKSNHGQIRPALDTEDAKRIAEIMLYSMGY